MSKINDSYYTTFQKHLYSDTSLNIPYFCHFHFHKKICFLCTVRKFHGFSITQILREINFGDSRSANSAILSHLETLNFDFWEFWYFVKAGNDQKIKIQILKMEKMAVLELLGHQNLISRKIWVIEKCWNFHTVL